MARIKSAKKRAKQSEKRRLVNVARLSKIKTSTKKVLAAIEANDVSLAQDLLRQTEAQIARAQKKGVLKRNTAANKISKLAKKVARSTSKPK